MVRAHRGDLEAARGGHLSNPERRVLDAITACRTQKLGGHVERCDQCGHERIAYNSCRNRHCPKCQERARETWIKEREKDLLPVPYFHVVFTIPRELGLVAFQNPRVVYGLLFKASAETLRTIASDPKHLGAEPGVLSILHTWGQNLDYHPHVHCVVTGGGLSPDHHRWVPTGDRFFLPVTVLARMFRGKFLHHLRRAHDQGKLSFRGALTSLDDPQEFRNHLSPLYEKDWFVYSKPPFGGPGRVLKYLGRYTHRVAISNSRLVEMKDGTVSFRWKDYANNCKWRVMTLTGREFLRRFLMHVLPKRFVRIRHYGILANRYRKEKIALCRGLLRQGPPGERDPDSAPPSGDRDEQSPCPRCQSGTMLRVQIIPPGIGISSTDSIPALDSS